MGKLLYFIFFLCWLPLQATEDTTTVASEKVFLTSDTASIALRSFPTDFKKKYTDKEFIYEFRVPEKNAWDRFKEWLAGLLRNMFNFSNDATAMRAVGLILQGIGIVIVITVIYLIVKSFLNKEGQWIFGKNSDRKVIRYNDIETNLSNTNFAQLISDALASGEKRLSIRYYYLWYLKTLSHNKMIEFDIEKTNSDYANELTNRAQKMRFEYLSYLYDYIWYGDFELDENTYSKTVKAFDDALNVARHE